MALLLGGLAAAGARDVVYTHPGLPRRASEYALNFLGVARSVGHPGYVMAAPAGNGAGLVAGWAGRHRTLLWLVVLAEYHTIDPRDPQYELARLWLSLVAYGVAFGFLRGDLPDPGAQYPVCHRGAAGQRAAGRLAACGPAPSRRGAAGCWPG